MIHPGKRSQIGWGDGNWIFLDIGFSGKARTCGLLVGDGVPRCLKFADAKSEIKSAIANSPVVNLVIEAPLSVCFDPQGNPSGRSIEIENSKSRYWYVGPGCSVMVAAMYLLRELSSADQGSIRLFEAFVSYKLGKKSNHQEDVIAMRQVVRYPARFQSAIYEGDQLKRNQSDTLFSAFKVLGLDFGVPAVIKPASTQP
jgi:hypothetical protein